VPSDMMHKYYKYDDYEELFLKSENELKKQAPARLVAIRNDADKLDKLKNELEMFLPVIFGF
jgi:hypothetical protein